MMPVDTGGLAAEEGLVRHIPIPEIDKPCLLVVEGPQDEGFFKGLLAAMSVGCVQVVNITGKDNLGPALRVLKTRRGFSGLLSLGVVRDADKDPQAAFEAVCGALRSATLVDPPQPLVPAGSAPRVIVMILPGEGRPGTLEDLCLESTLADPATPCVAEYLQCLQAQGLRAASNLLKARIQVFLASKPEVGNSLGVAAQRGYLDWSSEAFKGVQEASCAPVAR